MVSCLITLVSNLVSPKAQSLVPYYFSSTLMVLRKILIADDTMVFSIVNNPTISANELNHDLKVISQWAYQWKMKSNPDLNKQPTKLLFSCKKKVQITHLSSSMNLLCQHSMNRSI